MNICSMSSKPIASDFSENDERRKTHLARICSDIWLGDIMMPVGKDVRWIGFSDSKIEQNSHLSSSWKGTPPGICSQGMSDFKSLPSLNPHETDSSEYLLPILLVGSKSTHVVGTLETKTPGVLENKS